MAFFSLRQKFVYQRDKEKPQIKWESYYTLCDIILMKGEYLVHLISLDFNVSKKAGWLSSRGLSSNWKMHELSASLGLFEVYEPQIDIRLSGSIKCATDLTLIRL